MSALIRIHVADDSDSMRRSISMLRAAEPRIIVCGEASTYSDLVKRILALDPQVVLVHVHMPGGSHFEDTYIKGQLRRSRLLAMSVWKDEVTVRLAHSYGAMKLLDKSDLVSTLMPAAEECIHQKTEEHPS